MAEKRSEQNPVTGLAGSFIGLVTQEPGRQFLGEDEAMMTLKATVVPAIALAVLGSVVVALIIWLA